MKIAIVSMAKPETGTGVGTTEYTYQLILRLKEIAGNQVDSYYALSNAKRNDTLGSLYIYTFFKKEMAKLAKLDYDVIHITIQELGFVARILKENKTKAKIIVTVHDLIRLRKDLHKGIMQNTYNELVKGSINDALMYSDYITFNSRQTQEEVFERFGRIKNSRLIWHGTKREFFNTPIPKKTRKRKFVAGYIGSLGQHKNVIAILRVAKHLLSYDDIAFHIYGSGTEERSIKKFVKDNKLTNIEMRGFLDESELIKTYDSFETFVLPSLFEGLSHQILEAGARGVPILIFSNAKIPDEVTRHCIKAKNEEEMAKSILYLAQNGYKEKERKKEIEYYAEFTWDRTANQMYQLYKELVGK